MLTPEGLTLLELCYQRASKAGFDVAVVADSEVAAWCAERGMVWNHAPGTLIEELYAAGRYYQADTILQITGDCPFPDANRIKEVAAKLEDYNVAFVAYLKPKGFEVRGFRVNALERAIKAIEGFIEHGSTIFYDTPFFSHHILPGVYSNLNFSIDTLADKLFIRSIIKEIGSWATTEEIIACATRI